MKKRTTYSKAPKEVADALAAAVRIEDFLPRPENLVPREESVKVTLSLGKESVDCFKRAAREIHVPYQTMIRRIVDLYARHYMGGGTG